MKTIIVTVILVITFITGAFIFLRGDGDTAEVGIVNNVSIVDGKQIIEIHAKGGYQPRKSIAKSDIPTIITFTTNGTFDCSSSVRIPGMNISKSLPQSGKTDIDIGSVKLGTLNGSCGMGMYPFEIEFQ